MPITQIISGPKTFTFTYNTGVVQYVNKYAMRLSIDTNNTTVTFNDFKNNVFDLDITQITVPTTFATVGELVNFLTGQNIYNSTSEWYHGDSDPDVSFGANSDYFLNRITGDIWNKVAGIWTLINHNSLNGLPSGTTTGTDTYAVTIPGITAYNINTAFTINFSNANTNGSTLDINGLGPIPIYKNVDEEVVGGDIKAGQEFICIYDGTAFQIIGIKPNQMFAYVKNVDTVPLTKGMVVYAFGASGDKMSVKRALNTSDATSAKTVGLVYSTSIAVNGLGYIIMQGVIQGLNLGAYTAGDTLYLANTAGDYTATKPYAPNHLVYVGIVERANAGNGQIYVRVQNGFELDELHDVQAQSPANNDVLYYDLAATQWKTGNVTGTLQNAAADGTTKGVATFTAADFNDNGAGLISIDYTNGQAATALTKGFLTNSDWGTFNGKEPGIPFGTTSQWFRGDKTWQSLPNAVADGTTKGVATFTASDFNDNGSGVISIDYTNGQVANGSTKGFVTSADWQMFNAKIGGKIYKDHTDSAAVTGTTANTLVKSVLIPGGTFVVGDILSIIYRVRKVGTGALTQMRIYINTTATLAGATVLATNNTAAGTLFSQITREAVIKTATNTEVFTATNTAGTTDMINATGAASALNIDWTTDKYFIFAIQNNSTTDSTTASMYNIKLLE